jgi:hypothetical protein
MKVASAISTPKRKEQRLRKELAALKTGGFLSSDIHTACDLNSAFAHALSLHSVRHVSLQSTNALTKLGHRMLKTRQMAREEYLSTYEKAWADIVDDLEGFHPEAV